MAIEDVPVADTLEPLLPLSENVGNFNNSKLEEPECIPEWKDQITVRGLVVTALLGSLCCIMMHRLSLAAGVFPSLNVASALLAYFFIKTWTSFLSKFGFSSLCFTRQENTVIQTCLVACYDLASSGGFSTYLLAMDEKTYQLVGVDYPGNRAEDVKNPSLGWMISFLFVVSFLGVFSLVVLRKVMLIDYKLTYPSGTATAVLINSFHTKAGAELTEKQVSSLGKYLSLSFFWSCFKWFFSGVDDACGFDHFPSFGLALFKHSFYFDFNLSLVGCGFICPLIVGFSLLLGAIMFQVFLTPLFSRQAGNWYAADLGSNDLRGLNGYKLLLPTGLILGDGLYNVVKLIAITVKGVCNRTKQDYLPFKEEILDKETTEEDEQLKQRNKIFMEESIPTWFAAGGYIALAIISAVTVQIIFPPLKWYIFLGMCVIAPIFAFCNSYGCGLTDMNMATTYGKIGLLFVCSLIGRNGGVLAGLATCGITVTIASISADLMQDFRTGYLTLSSCRSMFAAQLIGTAMGCVIAPLTFWLFWNAFDVGSPDGAFKAPYAILYREMAILGLEGTSQLPKYSIVMFCAFFALAIAINILRDATPRKVSRFIPIPLALAAPAFIGGYFAVDVFTGGLIAYIWETRDRKDAEDRKAAVASGLICGDGLWSIPAAMLSILGINPPICISFAPSTSS